VVRRSLELVRISSPVRPPRFFQINHVNVAISGTRLGLSEVICTSASVTVLSAVRLIESQMHISFSFCMAPLASCPVNIEDIALRIFYEVHYGCNILCDTGTLVARDTKFWD
jgi:hypothetical protein